MVILGTVSIIDQLRAGLGKRQTVSLQHRQLRIIGRDQAQILHEASLVVHRVHNLHRSQRPPHLLRLAVVGAKTSTLVSHLPICPADPCAICTPCKTFQASSQSPTLVGNPPSPCGTQAPESPQLPHHPRPPDGKWGWRSPRSAVADSGDERRHHRRSVDRGCLALVVARLPWHLRDAH
jgi:hypothetical protein